MWKRTLRKIFLEQRVRVVIKIHFTTIRQKLTTVNYLALTKTSPYLPSKEMRFIKIQILRPHPPDFPTNTKVSWKTFSRLMDLIEEIYNCGNRIPKSS